jgi:[ribosomal protein S18]-alanine N-acetyltransferase
MATAVQVRTHIRWMIRRDMPEVCRIEAESFPSAWTEPDFLRCMRQRNCIGMVAEDYGADGKILGYMLYELHKAHLAVLNFAVHPHSRRRRIGTQMVDKLVAKLSMHRRTAIELVTNEKNLGSQLFWRAQGFFCEGVLDGYFEDTGDAGYCFAYRLPADAA